MNWKPEVFVEGKWSQNALVFATREEAEQNARDLLMRWFVPTDSRAAESDEPVNYRYVNGQLEQAAPAPELFTASGGWGELHCDIKTGNVVRYDRGGDWEKPGDGYDTITRLDVDEWQKFYAAGESLTAGHDILDFGSWDNTGLYVGAEMDWRFSWLADDCDKASERLSEHGRELFRAWQESGGRARGREVLRAWQETQPAKK